MGMRQYAARVRGALLLTGITQNELAKRLGIAPETLSRKMRRPERFTGAEIETIQRTFRWSRLGGEEG